MSLQRSFLWCGIGLFIASVGFYFSGARQFANTWGFMILTENHFNSNVRR